MAGERGLRVTQTVQRPGNAAKYATQKELRPIGGGLDKKNRAAIVRLRNKNKRAADAAVLRAVPGWISGQGEKP